MFYSNLRTTKRYNPPEVESQVNFNDDWLSYTYIEYLRELLNSNHRVIQNLCCSTIDDLIASIATSGQGTTTFMRRIVDSEHT
jgi:hypothetical protein